MRRKLLVLLAGVLAMAGSRPRLVELDLLGRSGSTWAAPERCVVAGFPGKGQA